MTPQERDLIATLLTRLKTASGQPKEPEAETQIRQAMIEQPDAPYYLVQTVLIQDLSLTSAQNRIAELEQQLAEARSQAAKPTSFLGGLFGGSQPAPPPATVPPAGPWNRGPQVAPPPGYAQPGYAPQQGYAQPGYAQGGGGGGMFGGGGGGGGFLRSAAATAAGVAGGALLFQGISSLFGHSYASSLGGFGGGGMGGMPGGLSETVVNNYYGDSGGSSGSGDFGGGGDYGGQGSGDYGSQGSGDYGGGGDSGDYGGGGDLGGGDYGGGSDSSSC